MLINCLKDFTSKLHLCIESSIFSTYLIWYNFIVFPKFKLKLRERVSDNFLNTKWPRAHILILVEWCIQTLKKIIPNDKTAKILIKFYI